MYEQDQQRPEGQHPGVSEAAQQHWKALAAQENLQEEFSSNYLGCWANKDSFGAELARDSGLATEAGPALGKQLGASRELAFVSDQHGVHVFVHPVGPDTRQARAIQGLRHLRLVPRVIEDGEAVALEQETTRPCRG
ncbi:MAG: hypothetical protein M3O32_00345 [Actinomycetota bacterium]|nr:hypothetical protein [Actinomycetota bacterium]